MMIRKSRDQLSAYRIRKTLGHSIVYEPFSPRKSTHLSKRSADNSYDHIRTIKPSSFILPRDTTAKDINSGKFLSYLPQGRSAGKRRETILGKTQALQSLISNFQDNQNELTEVKERQVQIPNLNEPDFYQQVIEDTCGRGYKDYKNDTKKNLVIEKFRVGNYKRKKMKTLFIFNNN